MLSTPDRKTLWARAGGRCSRCKRHDSEVRLMEAHIVAQPGGPRSDDPLPVDQREKYDNYILLCPNCHSVVDGREGEAMWPVERLRNLKKEHEEYIQMLVEAITEFAGSLSVQASDAGKLTGVKALKTTRFRPGAKINVAASNVGEVTGLQIGGNDDGG